MQLQIQSRGPSGHILFFRMQEILLVIQPILGGLNLILRSLLWNSLPLNHFPPSIFSWFSIQIQSLMVRLLEIPFRNLPCRRSTTTSSINQTWDMVPLPSGRKFFRCRWVYRIKSATDGKISRYKARIIVKGFQQVHGIDYDETFTPIANMDSIRLALSIMEAKGWEVHQMDVKSSFLHGDLSEEIYMEQP
jgi:hypothetical protein